MNSLVSIYIGKGKYTRPADLKGKTGRWSKWGAIENLFQDEVGDTWYCQSCGGEQPGLLPPYLMQHESTRLRVCPICYVEHLASLLERL